MRDAKIFRDGGKALAEAVRRSVDDAEQPVTVYWSIDTQRWALADGDGDFPAGFLPVCEISACGIPIAIQSLPE